MLFVVLEDDARAERVLESLEPRRKDRPEASCSTCLPLTLRHELLPAVRNAGSRIFVAPERERPWWRFWG